MEEKLALLDNNVSRSSKSIITCHWHQKPIDTAIKPNFRSRAPVQHKKILIQVMVPWVYIAKYNWLAFHQALAGPKIRKQNLLDQKSVYRG